MTNEKTTTRETTRSGPGPLHGIRVVDLSCVLSGPAATMLLADQGADVIKVEALTGDITRQMGRGHDGITSFFLSTNRGKRSIALDLKQAEGLAVVHRLVRTADVFVQNFRPGVIERLGLGHAAVRRLRDDIVYVSISGFGSNGPYAEHRVYDPVIQALSGLADIQSDAASGRPRMVRTIIPDKTTALTAAQAICAALVARERTGQGKLVEVAMLDTMIAYLWPEGMNSLTIVEDAANDGAAAGLAQDLVYETNDGYITAGAVTDDEWAGMCAALDRPQWLHDPRFATPAARVAHADVRLIATAEVLATRSTAQWLERLRSYGVPCAPVLRREQVLVDEQVLANDLILEYEHPRVGRVRQARPAARFSGTQVERMPVAPALGQHSEDILHELDYTATEISALTARGVIRL